MQFSLPSLVLCLSGLTLAQNTTKSSSGSAEELIRNTLATEAFLLDTRELTSLGQVYTDDAKIEWHNLGTTWDGLDTIISTEQSALNNSYTLMHQYTMSLINVYDNGTANATSYAIWNKFGVVNEGFIQQTWAKYADLLVEQDDGSWKFSYRTVDVVYGALTANMTVPE